MPDREAKSHDGKAVQSTRPPESAWMTHWTGTRFDSLPITHDQVSGDDHAIKKPHMPFDSFGSSGGVGLATSLKRPTNQSFPFFKLGQESGRSSIWKNEGEIALGSQAASKKLTAVANVENLSRECRFQPEGVSQVPTEHVKYHMFFGESSYSCSRPSKEKFTGSPSCLDMDQGGCNLDSLANREKSEMPPSLRRTNDPSMSSNHSSALIKEQYQRMQRHIGIGFSPEMMKSSTFDNVPHFVHDVETTRICTPLDSVEGLAGGLHRFSRTTHSLLITKQTDVNLYQENQIFRESRVSTQQLHCSPPPFAHGVKLQLLSTSSDRDLEENIEDVKTAGDAQENYSSADTDTMDMETFQERDHLSGVNSAPSDKDITVESSLPPLPSTPLATGKDRHGKRKIELPDMNLELSAQPAASCSTEKPEPCRSRTQSLDMNTLLFNDSKPDECSESNLGPEPGSRWIKRLKLTSSSPPALGAKTSSLAEASAHGKLSKIFSRIVEGKCERAESPMGESQSKEFGAQDQVARRVESASVEARGACEGVTLLHSWIQRWSHNQGRKNPETVGNGKPLAMEEELEKRKFPSIGAMALMGKAMTGFQQCEFQKKDSFVVWNTKAFES